MEKKNLNDNDKNESDLKRKGYNAAAINVSSPVISSLVSFPLKIAGNVVSWSYDTIVNSSIAKSYADVIYKQLSKTSDSFDKLSGNSEIKKLIVKLTRNFIVFVGSIIEEVGEDAMNEFFQIFFKMLTDMGMKLISGFSEVLTGLLMGLIGEIPVAGGIVDIIATVLTSFNDIVGSITPIIRGGVKIIASGLNTLTSVYGKFFNNPLASEIYSDINVINSKVFNGFSFFGYLTNMFGSMKDNVTDMFNKKVSIIVENDGANANAVQSLGNVAEKTFGDMQTKTGQIDTEMKELKKTNDNYDDNDAPPPYTPRANSGGRRIRKLVTYTRKNNKIMKKNKVLKKYKKNSRKTKRKRSRK